MFYNDKDGIDKTIYLNIFWDLIKKMENLEFEVKPFEFVSGIKNLKIDLNNQNKKLDLFERREISRRLWLTLDKELRGTGFSIVRCSISPEALMTYSHSYFLNLTPFFIESLEKANYKPLIASVHVERNGNEFWDAWFDYIKEEY